MISVGEPGKAQHDVFTADAILAAAESGDQTMNYFGQMRFKALPAATLLASVWCWPAAAQRSCSATGFLKNTNTALVTQVNGAKRTDASTAQAPVVIVTGGGQATLTDTDGEKSPHQFSITAIGQKDGSARGQIEFVFSRPFSLKWGALPGVSEIVTLHGEVNSAAIRADGATVLSGPWIETDYASSQGIVFREDSRTTGASPLVVVIPASAPNTFTITWCTFIPPDGSGSFSAQVTNGNLSVR
jgi:hypothetical protein